MRLSRSEPGIVISAAAHVALLAAALVVFSDTKKFVDATEAIPIETISDKQFNEITKGDQNAPDKTPPTPKADKAEPVVREQPKPPIAEAKKDTPAPPPPLKRIPDPAEDEPVPEPPRRVAAAPPEKIAPEPPAPLPPTRPPQVSTPKPPTPKSPEPKPPEPEKIETPPKPEAEAVLPPPRPKEEPKKVEPKKVEPKKVETPPKPEPDEDNDAPPAPTPPRRPANLPKPAEKPKPDQVAKLIDNTKTVQPTARPRSGDDTPQPQRRFDPNDISRLLSKEPAERRGASAPVASRTAPRGAPNANAARMAPSMWSALDGYIMEQYRRCWSYLGTAAGGGYKPQISVKYSQTGGLIGRPTLTNPSSDPEQRALGESALRAVRQCDPLRIPAQYAPYYEEWKDRLLRFDPAEMT